MSRRRSSKQRGEVSKKGRVTIDRQRKSGHYQATNYSEVYRDGKVYVYTCWDDNAPEVGQEMPFDEWVRSVSR
ncbi:MAG: hypothetical protein H6742_08415 [Alphaproteobacteria bacterium]|nr:hypothetical protein [Alphaproteobacteria bacterium]